MRDSCHDYNLTCQCLKAIYLGRKCYRAKATNQQRNGWSLNRAGGKTESEAGMEKESEAGMEEHGGILKYKEKSGAGNW